VFYQTKNSKAFLSSHDYCPTKWRNKAMLQKKPFFSIGHENHYIFLSDVITTDLKGTLTKHMVFLDSKGNSTKCNFTFKVTPFPLFFLS
jgi:hypothetical protein